MKTDEQSTDSDHASRGPKPKVEVALEILMASCDEEIWKRFMDDLSCRAAFLVKQYYWVGVRPDSSDPKNDSFGKHLNAESTKRINELAVEGYRKVANGSWDWDPTSKRYDWLKRHYPNWPSELVCLYGFLWDRLKSHVNNLLHLDYYKYGAAPASAEDEHTKAVFSNDKESAVSALWDKETQELDHTAGEFSNSYKLAPYQELVIRDDWDELIREISSTNYEDKDLIMQIAENCKVEIMSGINKKRKGYVQKKGAEPRELVEDILGIEYETLPKNSPILTAINKAKGKLKKVLTLVGVKRCIEAGCPEFDVIYQYLRNEAGENESQDAITTALAGKLKKEPSDTVLLLKEFVEHWNNWFNRHHYFVDPGLPCLISDLKPLSK